MKVERLDILRLFNVLIVFIAGLYCHSRFDGWSCWPNTPAGSTANQSCIPIIGFDPNSELSIIDYYICVRV